jgi:hypothetical protein
VQDAGTPSSNAASGARSASEYAYREGLPVRVPRPSARTVKGHRIGQGMLATSCFSHSSLLSVLGAMKQTDHLYSVSRTMRTWRAGVVWWTSSSPSIPLSVYHVVPILYPCSIFHFHATLISTSQRLLGLPPPSTPLPRSRERELQEGNWWLGIAGRGSRLGSALPTLSCTLPLARTRT